MSNLMSMKYNLIQNFYIIGLSPEDICPKSESNKNKIIDIFRANTDTELTPKIISKFPPTNSNVNSIPNEIIIEQCFPNGFKMVNSQNKNNISHFSFELDNLKYSYLKYKSLYSKIYFTCLKFYEPLHKYQKMKTELNKTIKIEPQTNNITKNNIINDRNALFIPKVICLASLLPFTKELNKILNNLYDYCLYYNANTDDNTENDLSPIEKIVEQIVMCIPFPISLKNEYCISYKFNYPLNSSSLKNINQNSINNFPFNINFKKYDPLMCFMNDIYSLPLSELFVYFNEEEILKIFKYITLEIPILFFSENIELLSQMIQGLLSLLQPFTYVQPNATILPFKFYGIINIESKFIFGIGQNYRPDFFKQNNILLDKSIIVVYFLNKKGKIEEVKKTEELKDYVIIDNYNIFNYINNESVLPNGTKIDEINIDFPIKPKKKIINFLKSYLSEYNKKKKENDLSEEYEHVFNQKIRNLFYRLFTNILIGYTDYLLQVNNNIDNNNIDNNNNNIDNNNNNNKTEYYSGDNIRYKIEYNHNINNGRNMNNYYNNEILLIKSVFNMDEYISKLHKDNHIFYRAFFNTKLFQNFIREIIFCKDEQISLNHKYFDFITFIKKHKDIKKNNKYKDLFLTFKNLFNKKNEIKQGKSQSKILNISTDVNFNLDEKKILVDKNKQNQALTNYAQLIDIPNESNKNQDQLNKINNNIFNRKIYVKYLLFPKLLFDNEFFDINYEELFYRHYLEMPDHLEIKKLYDKLKILNKYYFDIYKEIMVPKNQHNGIISSKSINELRGSLKFDFNNSITYPNECVLIDNYIEYNWLLLISCSLWYCFDQLEIEIRINRIFIILEKIDFIEEQVLFFLYMSIYNFGNKSQLIKMFDIMVRFIGYSSYTNLIYLCLKLNEEKVDINDNGQIKVKFKDRSFFDIKKINNENNNEINENTNEDNIKNKTSYKRHNYKKEEIVFHTIQKCPKCKKENKIDNISDMIHHKISQKRDNLYYKCTDCGEDKLDIIIDYKISHYKNKTESLLTTEGYFKLIPPHKIYQQMKEKLIYLDDYKLDIDHIFSNDNIHLLNNIFYFSELSLPFDFLIPYEGQEDRESFTKDEEQEQDIFENINIINNDKNNDNFQICSMSSNNSSFIGKNL